MNVRLRAATRSASYGVRVASRWEGPTAAPRAQPSCRRRAPPSSSRNGRRPVRSVDKPRGSVDFREERSACDQRPPSISLRYRRILSAATPMLDVRCDTPRHDEPTDRPTRRETTQIKTSPTDRSPPPVLTPNNQSTERVVAFLFLVRFVLRCRRVESTHRSFRKDRSASRNFRLLPEVVAPYPTKPAHSSAPRGAAHSSSARSRTRTTRIDRRKPLTYCLHLP
jgi:hypothetical protein